MVISLSDVHCILQGSLQDSGHFPISSSMWSDLHTVERSEVCNGRYNFMAVFHQYACAFFVYRFGVLPFVKMLNAYQLIKSPISPPSISNVDHLWIWSSYSLGIPIYTLIKCIAFSPLPHGRICDLYTECVLNFQMCLHFIHSFIPPSRAPYPNAYRIPTLQMCTDAPALTSIHWCQYTVVTTQKKANGLCLHISSTIHQFCQYWWNINLLYFVMLPNVKPGVYSICDPSRQKGHVVGKHCFEI